MNRVAVILAGHAVKMRYQPPCRLDEPGPGAIAGNELVIMFTRNDSGAAARRSLS